MSKIRLDDMNITEVINLYNPMFIKMVDKEKLDELSQKYTGKYNKMITAQNDGYKAPSAMGRGFKYLKNIIFGWYFEELFALIIKKNTSVQKLEFTGNDSQHELIYNSDTKTISIAGEKTTIPDYLITLKNNSKFYLELKTAAAEVFTIKNGNVKQIYETMGNTNIYSMIIMIDLVNQKYDIENIKFFVNKMPFVNQRMEGQLCYEFPSPSKSFDKIVVENFDSYIDQADFEMEEVIKYKCLHFATENGNAILKKEIKNKIALDELNYNFKYQKDEYNKQYDKLVSKSPDIQIKTWDEYLKEIEE